MPDHRKWKEFSRQPAKRHQSHSVYIVVPYYILLKDKAQN
jgi:hypothetical protein